MVLDCDFFINLFFWAEKMEGFMFPKMTGKDFRLLKKMHALVGSSKYLRKISKTSFFYGLAAFLCAEETDYFLKNLDVLHCFSNKSK